MSDRDTDAARRDYVAQVLRAYRATPSVVGHVRRADRELAGQLFDDGVPLYAVSYALTIAAARRIRHNAFSTPMPAVRSLHYFVAVIREVLERPPGPREIDELRRTLRFQDPLL
ncbi:MAG TPA: hypothetical protein VN894_09680 [Polyangiaceae bacterium]|nr:hypothetical protein [Polyangiaceae bacterium]